MDNSSNLGNNDIPTNAISLYGQDDTVEEFPVLKAFQQYIDAEHEKARKRLVSMGIFFGVLMILIISVFVVLLIYVTTRNQALNDRMIEYAMRDRDNRGSSAVVVQSPQPPAQDNTAMLTLTTKIDEMQKKMAENQAKAERAVAEAETKARQAAIEAMMPKPPSPQELEIARLKALLEVEKQQAANKLEKEKQRQNEIEAYRRKHYPELYEPSDSIRRSSRRRRDSFDDIIKDLDSVIDSIDDDKAISYFDDDDDVERRAVNRNVHKPDGVSASLSRNGVSQKCVTPTDESVTTEPKEGIKPTPIQSQSAEPINWRIPTE